MKIKEIVKNEAIRNEANNFWSEHRDKIKVAGIAVLIGFIGGFCKGVNVEADLASRMAIGNPANGHNTVFIYGDDSLKRM